MFHTICETELCGQRILQALWPSCVMKIYDPHWTFDQSKLINTGQYDISTPIYWQTFDSCQTTGICFDSRNREITDANGVISKMPILNIDHRIQTKILQNISNQIASNRHDIDKSPVDLYSSSLQCSVPRCSPQIQTCVWRNEPLISAINGSS